MFNILIVEDDSFKSKSICEFIESHMADISIDIVTNNQCAITKINEFTYDLILVDMAIPSHPIHSGTGSPINLLNGGLQVILELDFLDHLNVKTDCIILTQYPDIEISGEYFPINKASEGIKKLYNCTVLNCIQYVEDSPTWKNELLVNLSTYENFNP